MDPLLQRLSRWIDTASVPALALPRRWVVLGRTSAGKTTLVNALTGSSAPTGLGGITPSATSRMAGDWVWIDTPGIDSRDRALIELGPLVDTAHGVIWVVDGLQPVTRTEREVMDLLIPPRLPVQMVISRADLVPDDLASVLARVERHSAPFHPLSILPRDLRHSPDLRKLRCYARTPDEIAQRIHALAPLVPLLDASRPLDAHTLLKTVTLRARVKAWLERLTTRDASVSALLASFQPELQEIADDAIIRWTNTPALSERLSSLPPFPSVPDPARSAIDSFRMNAAGLAGTHRELRSLASSWVAEVEVALADWRDQQIFDSEALQAHQAAVDALSSELRELGHQHDEG